MEFRLPRLWPKNLFAAFRISRFEHEVSIARIQQLVAQHYKIDVENLKARSNVRQVLLPRQVAMYLCKRLAKKSYPEIAKHFGGKHHTTVIHSVEKIEKEMNSNR